MRHDQTQDPDPRTSVDRNAQSEHRWQALPAAIRATFDCTRKVPIHQALRILDVETEPSDPVERAYASKRGTLVVTVWHDQIEQVANGSLEFWIDTFEWRPQEPGAPVTTSMRTRELLTGHKGQAAYALLLKRGWDAVGVARVERCAVDVVTWTVEPAGRDWFVLRRPMARQPTPVATQPGAR